MKIEKVIKWTFSIGLIFIILIINYQKYESTIFQDGVTAKPSYYKNSENIKLLFNIDQEANHNLTISSLIDDFNFSKTEKYNVNVSDNMLFNGLDTNMSINLSTSNFKNSNSEFYLVNEKIPLILKSPENTSDITIVYPYMNNIISKPFNDKTVFSEQLTSTTLNRPNELDESTINIKPFIGELVNKYSVSYISDLDLEIFSDFENSKLLIIYGDFHYTTLKMKKNILKFLEQGGRILLASTFFLNNGCEYKADENKVLLNPELARKNIDKSSSNIMNLYEFQGKNIENELGLSYGNGGKIITNSNFEIKLKEHFVFKEVEDSVVPVTSNLFLAVEQLKNDSMFIPYFDEVKVLAGCNGFYNLKKGVFGILECHIQKGKLISLGTKDWFAYENYKTSKIIKTISMNAVDYLMK